MVALAIVAHRGPGAAVHPRSAGRRHAYLRDRSLARIVASNRLSELRLALRGRPAPPRGRLSGSEETLAGRDWFWRVQHDGDGGSRFFPRGDPGTRPRDEARRPVHARRLPGRRRRRPDAQRGFTLIEVLIAMAITAFVAAAAYAGIATCSTARSSCAMRGRSHARSQPRPDLLERDLRQFVEPPRARRVRRCSRP
jgi:prepilin-type N-terminal cleavage/methylation domain-containing protein